MPSKASAVAFSNVYVTLRDVEDEEILADYRLDPTNGYPQWYKPIDEKRQRRVGRSGIGAPLAYMYACVLAL